MLVELPGEKELTYHCPFCNTPSLLRMRMSPIGYTEKKKFKLESGRELLFDLTLSHLVYQCVKCKKDTYFLLRERILQHDSFPGSKISTVILDEPAAIIHQYPHPHTSATRSPGVPDEVHKATLEAEKCLDVKAPNACGVMARRAMDAICDDKEAKGKDCFTKLEYLRDNHLITPDLWASGDELRTAGKVGAHPEWEELTLEQADYVISLLREVIRYVYINPHERKSRMLKNKKKRRMTSPEKSKFGQQKGIIKMSEYDFFLQTVTGRKLQNGVEVYRATTNANKLEPIKLLERNLKDTQTYRVQAAKDLVELYSNNDKTDVDYFDICDNQSLAEKIEKKKSKDEKEQAVSEYLERHYRDVADVLFKWALDYYKNRNTPWDDITLSEWVGLFETYAEENGFTNINRTWHDVVTSGPVSGEQEKKRYIICYELEDGTDGCFDIYPDEDIFQATIAKQLKKLKGRIKQNED